MADSMIRKGFVELSHGRIYLRRAEVLFLYKIAVSNLSKQGGIILKDSIPLGKKLSVTLERFLDVNKLPFEYVDREVDKLYDKKLDGPLEDHIAFISTFIQACGWTEDDFNDIKHGVAQRYRNLKAN